MPTSQTNTSTSTRLGPLHNEGFHETFLEITNENGRRNNFTPIGTALLWAPFYGAGHCGRSSAASGQDGYGPPYIRMVTFGSACYGLIALLLSSAIARRVLGAALHRGDARRLDGHAPLFYMYVAPGFGHACSAFAVSLFLWTWLRVRDLDAGGRAAARRRRRLVAHGARAGRVLSRGSGD